MSDQGDQRTVLLYSDDPKVRERMRLAIGPRPASDLAVRFIEAATGSEVIDIVNAEDVDLLFLDGEATPTGGLSVARSLRDEVPYCPLICVVLARAADRWLAASARVDATLLYPLDPMVTVRTVTDLLREDETEDEGQSVEVASR